jgi:hypothetical protein
VKNLNEIFDKLDINPKNGLLMLSNSLWDKEIDFPIRIKRLLNNIIKPNAIFCLDNKPLILFFENPTNRKELYKQIWNFNESPIVIIVEKGVVEIFNGFEYKKELESLTSIGNEKLLDDFAYFKLVTGESWEKYQSELKYQNRIDHYLLNNINDARRILVNQHHLIPRIANALIGKCIFVRYLIDRHVQINIEGFLSSWDNNGFCKLLTDAQNTQLFFNYLKEKFNGDDIFPLDENDFSQITNDSLGVLIKLLKSEKLSSGQQSLFDLYDFSIIPIEFISNVYELFIGQENQEKEGAYYTPLFLVDYILKETIERNFAVNKKSFKVLDPSCGSGIFLVENLRKIIEQNFPNNNNCDKEKIKALANENIFGVDKDKNAIQVAIFSIYLTLLDYQTPADIDQFKFPKLLNTNFFEADFFDETHIFNDVFSRIKFDYIVGNPPWKRGKGGEKKPSFVKYIEGRKKTEKEKTPSIEIGNAEIAQAFVLRAMDFANDKTNCALIINSKSLYNSGGKGFRDYLLFNNNLKRVLELAPVRREIFNTSNDSAIAPAAVLFFQNNKDNDTSNNIVEHISVKPSRFFSMFKIMAIFRSDIKEVEQHLLREYDWLWKTLVYGSYLDFNFIKRLKENYPTIGDVIKDETKFIAGQGAMVNGGDHYPSSEYMGLPFLDTRKDVKSFWINPTPEKKWTMETAHRPRKKQLFTAPALLIKGGTDDKFRIVVSLLEYDALYTDAIAGVKSLKNEYDKYLPVFAGILTSSLFSYFGLQTFSYLGIERENTNDEEKWKLPFVYSSNIEKFILEIVDFQKKGNSFKDLLKGISDFIEKKGSEIGSEIANIFHFSKIEISLIEYANECIIPIQMEHKGFTKLFLPIKEKDKYLAEYANLFIERFAPIFAKSSKKFVVRIMVSPKIIAMFFEVTDGVITNIPIIWESFTDNNMMKLTIGLSTEKMSDKLFIQKDIRGFEKERFYIIKPNEKRLWHKAIGYMDVEEFMDAILTVGGNK